jgi:hypothetical protein
MVALHILLTRAMAIPYEATKYEFIQNEKPAAYTKGNP